PWHAVAPDRAPRGSTGARRRPCADPAHGRAARRGAPPRGGTRGRRVPRRRRRLPRAAEERLPVTDADRRSALVVVAAEAERVVGEWRLRYQRNAVER